MNPEERITAYLATHRASLEFSTIDRTAKDVKLSVFFGISPISDDEIRKIVARWASFNAIGMFRGLPDVDSSATPATTAAPPATSNSDLIDAVKKAISSVTDGVTIGKKDANINIGVTGPTANLKKGDNSVSLGISWGGTLKLDAASGPFHFSGNLSKDKWEITLSFPEDTYIPDLSSLGKVFTEGEKAVGKMADATRSFNNLNDTRAIGALIKPNAAAVQDAVDAVSGIANAPKKGGASFGFKLGSPEPGPGQQGMPGGVQGSFVFTYVF